MDKINLKSTLKLILYILVVTYVVDKVIYFSLNMLSDKILSGQAVGKLNHFITVKDSVDIVTFGNSRTNHHINPQKLSGSGFNMGADARSIAFCATLIKLLPENKEQLVIVNVDSKNVFDPKYSGIDISPLRIRYHRSKVIKREIDRVFSFDPIQNFYWSKGYNGKVLGLFKNYFVPKYDHTTYYGYDPIYVNETQREIFRNFLKNPKRVECKEEYVLSDLYKSYLDEIKAFCTKNNKKLVLITAPFYDDVCKKDNQKMKQVFEEMQFEYYDFSDVFKENNKIEYWKDDVHLSDEGAQLFSEILNKTLVKK
ncbi:SGNH/GDSL hydrolase family protein [Aquimarina sp. D1M17]|uniref:SGNH/GDSL hydrolase family protein n=1 Tax=Aquimarina acroporae TaxID=2937283 RepID=UPI0020BD58A3|nr:SGNH/GDSL hydrolase family protein [Aquimarina acroporae]MCK8520573.1 SGNH/GDSL hydrolase family protein [Aquimarina acroporae]